jgi:uncharacterized membrane protein HdeD (DUF308 family)
MLSNTYASFLPILYIVSGVFILLCGIIMVTLQLKMFSKTNARRPREKKLLIAGIASIITGLILIIAFIN